ncbi:MAG: DUF262 domain-containing protein [Cytophagales bacterium]|nr:DUF262 domain-containing protein [Cytophagales bacterium]
MEAKENQYTGEDQHKDEPIEAGDGTEKELNDETVELMEKPFDPTLIKIETKTPSLDTLIKRIDRSSIQMNTENYFQRQADLWDKTKQSRLLESILIRFPLPAFFFDSSDDDNWLVVDGLQRLSSIRNFVVNKSLKLRNLEFLTHLNDKGWDELPENLQRVIEEAQVVIYKIMPGTPTDVKFNIFKRINTGGLILEPQEIRHALFQGKPATFVAKLAQTDAFIMATDGKIKTHRMLDRDFANRFLGFYLLGVENYGTKEYGQDLDTYMSKAMAAINNKSDDQLTEIISAFSEAMELAKSIFDKEAFRKVHRDYIRLPPINKALFDALSTQFALLTEEEKIRIRQNKAEFKRRLRSLIAEDDYFFTSITSSTGDKRRVTYRHSSIKDLIQDVITNRI